MADNYPYQANDPATGSAASPAQTPAYAAQYAQQPYAGTASGAQMANPTAVFVAQNNAITRTYLEMTIALVITALTSWATYASGIVTSMDTDTLGVTMIVLAVVEIALAFIIPRVAEKLNAGVARALFYGFAVLNGLTLFSIFYYYDITSIALVFLITAGFFFALTMLALTTRKSMLGLGPILLTALVVLIIAEVVLMFVVPSDGVTKLIAAIGIVIFAGFTAYDTQTMRAVFARCGSDTKSIESYSVLFALSLYLDFINLFLYLLRLFGNNK
ncbi:MAG: Bax inhibitor-1/YccA family protein [Pseudoscardovia radai]|nr:Bax inhibitor-1/YccA family protein [Pseudoscardovia radai]